MPNETKTKIASLLLNYLIKKKQPAFLAELLNLVRNRGIIADTDDIAFILRSNLTFIQLDAELWSYKENHTQYVKQYVDPNKYLPPENLILSFPSNQKDTKKNNPANSVICQVTLDRLSELLKEKASNPHLSDNTISNILNSEGHHISRRTVAKYRLNLYNAAIQRHKKVA